MKLERHAKIIELIHAYDIETQEELASRLNEAGFSVTQATVSRDIRELKLTKVAGADGHSKYEVLHPVQEGLNEKYIRIVQNAMVSMDQAMNLVVLKTVPGMAQGVGVALDAMKWTEVVGCIAGDDTIFCATRSVEEALTVMERLRKIIESGK